MTIRVARTGIGTLPLAHSGITNTKTVATIGCSSTWVSRLAITVFPTRVATFIRARCVLRLAAAVDALPKVRTLLAHIADLRGCVTATQLGVTNLWCGAITGTECRITFSIGVTVASFTALTHIAVFVPAACGPAGTGLDGGGRTLAGVMAILLSIAILVQGTELKLLVGRAAIMAFAIVALPVPTAATGAAEADTDHHHNKFYGRGV
jgi:hypothetical protein